MATLSALSQIVEGRVRDAAGKLSPSAIEDALAAAVETYGRDVPREVAVTVDGSGGFDVPLSALGAAATDSTASTQWSDGFSAIREVVYPYDAASRDRLTLDPEEYAIVRLPEGEVLRFLTYTLAVGTQALIVYTVPHAVYPAFSTIPPTAEHAVCSLAAAVALESLAAYYAQATDSSLDADVVDHRGRPVGYLELARAYRRAYAEHVGRGESGLKPAAAGGFVDLDLRFANPSRTDRFFHGTRGR